MLKFTKTSFMLGKSCLSLKRSNSSKSRWWQKKVCKKCASGLKKKKGFKLRSSETLDFTGWAHLGLNQGPPDYESGALTD